MLFIIVLLAGESKIKVPADSMSSESSTPGKQISCVLYGKGKGVPGIFFIMSVIKFMRALLSRPSHLPRPHLFIPSHLELDSSLLYNWPSLETIMEKEMATHSLENPRDRGAWWAAIYGVAQSRTQLKRLTSSSSRNFALSKRMGTNQVI